MRVFIALELPESAVDMLCALQDKLVESGIGGKQVPRPNLHITLKFIGDCDKKTSDQICAVVKETLKTVTAPIVCLNGISAFVRTGGDIVYAQIGGDVKALEDIKNKLSKALTDINIPQDSQPFVPHITLARKAKFGTRQASASSEQFFCGSVVVYDSDILVSPPTYKKLYIAPLSR